MPDARTAARWTDRVPGSPGHAAWHLASVRRGRQQQTAWRWLGTDPSPRRVEAVLAALHRYPEPAAMRPFLVLAGSGRLSGRALTRVVAGIPHGRMWLLRSVLTMPGIDPQVLAHVALSYNDEVFTAASANPGFSLDAQGWRRAAVDGRTHAAAQALARTSLDAGDLGRVVRRGDLGALILAVLDTHADVLTPAQYAVLARHDDVRVVRAVAGCVATPQPVLVALAAHADRPVRVAVAGNPACPQEAAVAAALSF